MGVKECDRTGCDHIMCGQLILDDFYICEECLSELMEFKKTLPERMMMAEIRDAVVGFMKTAPGTYSSVDTNEEFDRILGIRRGGDDW